MGQNIRLLQLRATAIALGFGTTLLLAHGLGSEGFGRFEATLAWALLGTTLVLGGSQRYSIREIAKARAGHDDDSVAVQRLALREHLGRRTVWIVGLSLPIVGALFLMQREDLALRVLVATCILTPIQVQMQRRQALLQGFDRPVAGQVAEFLVLPLGIATTALLLSTLDGLSVTTILSGTVGATILGLLVTGRLVDRLVGLPRMRTTKTGSIGAGTTGLPHLRLGPLVRTFLWLEVFRILDARIDLLLLDLIGESSEAGVFAAASRLANLLAVVLLAANTVLAPKLAAANARNDEARMQALLTATARRTLLLALPLGTVIVVVAPTVLELLGSDFGPAEVPMRWLLGAQFVNIATGSAGVLLQMTGHEGRVLKVLCIATPLHLLLSAVLIPAYGALGAALSASASIVGWNLALTWNARRVCGLDPTPLGLIPRAGSN